jgi:hypothetical protein
LDFDNAHAGRAEASQVFIDRRLTLKAQCLNKPTTARQYLSIPVDTHELNLTYEMKAKTDSEPGKRIYARRLGVIEPVFANIFVQKLMNRFTLRTS